MQTITTKSTIHLLSSIKEQGPITFRQNRGRKLKETVEKIRTKNETSSWKGKFKKMNETAEKTEQEPEKREDEPKRRKNEAEEELKTDQNENKWQR